MSALGDASKLAAYFPPATVFFLYCPFSGDRLALALAAIEVVACTRPVRVCCVDLPLPARPWLTLEPPLHGDVTVYRTSLHDRALEECVARNQRTLASVLARRS